MFILISEPLRGLEELWFIGDKFMDRSYTQNYKVMKNANNSAKWYTPEHYEMYDYATTRYSSLIRNILVRLKALVNKAIKERTYLPKAIVFVLDEVVIKQSNIPLVEAREGDYSTVVKYLMEQTHRLITSHASKLPAKSK